MIDEIVKILTETNAALDEMDPIAISENITLDDYERIFCVLEEWK